MVESGPYIEYNCQVYVQRTYVLQCVLVALVIAALTAAALLALWYWKNKKEP